MYETGSKAKNPQGLQPLGFLALELPRENIHQDTPSPFPHIVSIGDWDNAYFGLVSVISDLDSSWSQVPSIFLYCTVL